jgi:hypothetical protein
MIIKYFRKFLITISFPAVMLIMTQAWKVFPNPAGLVMMML